MSDDPSRLPPMGRATIHGEPDTVISSYAREEINATALVGHPAASRCSDDVGQGQGWQRNIVMDGSPHLHANIRQWYGDSRGHWEGNTLVIDVTNFSPKTDFQGRVRICTWERWTRTSPTTLDYVVTVEDPTVWVRPWAAKQEFILQNNDENRIYTEPRCIEGNYGLPGLLHGHRVQET